ncbi:hypothetical protein L9F63_008724, partial [Diploptera punctata]
IYHVLIQKRLKPTILNTHTWGVDSDSDIHLVKIFADISMIKRIFLGFPRHGFKGTIISSNYHSLIHGIMPKLRKRLVRNELKVFKALDRVLR